jgi:hypothetical protein
MLNDGRINGQREAAVLGTVKVPQTVAALPQGHAYTQPDHRRLPQISYDIEFTPKDNI